MRLRINGEQREFTETSTLADVLNKIEAPERGIAVALDGEIVPRAGWSTTRVTDGARVEIVTATQGG